MKTIASLLATVLSLLLADNGWAQGTVNFSNATSAYGTNVPDHLVRWDPFIGFPLGNTLVGSNSAGFNFSTLRAQLFYGPSTISAPGSLTAVTDAPATFRSTSSANVGSWIGGFRTLFGFQPGDTVRLNVIVWDVAFTPDPLQALAGAGGVFGTSGIFSYTIPAAGSQPTAYLPANQPPFFVTIPEPGTFALVAVGATALTILRRRK